MPHPSVRPVPARRRGPDRRLAVAVVLAAGPLSATAAPVHADTPPSPWSLSGFGTVGITSQSGADGLGFRRTMLQPGATAAVRTDTDTRAGLQVNWRGVRGWDAAAQVVVLDRAPGSPATESVEWAYAGLPLGPNTRVRAGRTGLDLFLFADSRNVGYALTWARPPVEFYGPLAVSSVDGADFEHRWSTAAATWRTRLGIGRHVTSASLTTGERLALRGRDIRSVHLVREQGGLLLKASALRSHLQAEAPVGLGDLRSGLDRLAALPVPGLAEQLAPLRRHLWSGGAVHYRALGAQFDHGPWTLAAEASALRVQDSPLDARAAYASAGYRHGPVTWYGMAGRIAPRQAPLPSPDLITPLAPVLGPQAAAQAQRLVAFAAAAGAPFRHDQRTLALGLRWDFASRAAFKLQADRIAVAPVGAGLWRGTEAGPARATVVTGMIDVVWGP